MRHVDGYPILYHPIRGPSQKLQSQHQSLQPQTSSPAAVPTTGSTTTSHTNQSLDSHSESPSVVKTVGRFKVSSTNKLSPFNNIVQPRQSVSLSSSPAASVVITPTSSAVPPRYTTCFSVDESLRKRPLTENGLYGLKNSQSQPELR